MARTRTKKRARTSPQKKLATLMRGIDLCMMTTHGTNNSLHARPMSNNGEVDFGGDAWFFTWRDTSKVKELEKDPRVSLSYAGGPKRAPVWISVTGKGRIVEDPAKKLELWQDGLGQWFEDGPEDPDVVLIHVTATRAQWWSYKGEGDVSL